MKLVFLHGWSFDPHFWDPLHAALGHPEALFLDQGYTGAPMSMTLPDMPYLAIAHSAGVLDFLACDRPLCRGLVAFNGFARFSQAQDYPSGIARRILSRMGARLALDPSAVVTQFRQQFDPFLPCCAALDVPALKNGLDRLITADGRDAARQWGTSLLSVSGRHDPLVSEAMIEASFPMAEKLTLEGGHLLPVTDPDRCAAIIASRLEHGA